MFHIELVGAGTLPNLVGCQSNVVVGLFVKRVGKGRGEYYGATGPAKPGQLCEGGLCVGNMLQDLSAEDYPKRGVRQGHVADITDNLDGAVEVLPDVNPSVPASPALDQLSQRLFTAADISDRNPRLDPVVDGAIEEFLEVTEDEEITARDARPIRYPTGRNSDLRIRPLVARLQAFTPIRAV